MTYTLCRICGHAIATASPIIQGLWSHVYNPAANHDGHLAEPKDFFLE